MENSITKIKVDECKQISVYVFFANLLISIAFLITGCIGKSIAAVSEGIDSLTDAASSLLLLIGFKISSRKPDSLHPNGHKRFEYIIGLLLSEIILFTAYSLGKKSIRLIIHPASTPFSPLLIVVLLFGISGKLLISRYINKKNRTINSVSLDTYRKNAMSDFKAIFFIIISTIVQAFTTLSIDAFAGLILAVIICLDGLKSFFKNVSLIIGEGNDVKSERSSYANQ